MQQRFQRENEVERCLRSRLSIFPSRLLIRVWQAPFSGSPFGSARYLTTTFSVSNNFRTKREGGAVRAGGGLAGACLRLREALAGHRRSCGGFALHQKRFRHRPARGVFLQAIKGLARAGKASGRLWRPAGLLARAGSFFFFKFAVLDKVKVAVYGGVWCLVFGSRFIGLL